MNLLYNSFFFLIFFIGGINTPTRKGTAKRREYVGIHQVSLLITYYDYYIDMDILVGCYLGFFKKV